MTGRTLVKITVRLALLLASGGYAQDVIIQEEAAAPPPKTLGAFQVSANYGYSYIIAEIPTDMQDFMQDYYQELYSGTNFSGGGTYYVNQQFGIGLKYTRFHTKNTITGLVTTDPGTGATIYGGITDDVIISFIGAVGTARNIAKGGKFIYLANASVGLATYTDNFNVFGWSAVEKGNTMGVMIGVGGDLMLSHNVALGVELNLLLGTVYNITIDNEPFEGEETLNRFDLNVGLRFFL